MRNIGNIMTKGTIYISYLTVLTMKHPVLQGVNEWEKRREKLIVQVPTQSDFFYRFMTVSHCVDSVHSSTTVKNRLRDLQEVFRTKVLRVRRKLILKVNVL